MKDIMNNIPVFVNEQKTLTISEFNTNDFKLSTNQKIEVIIDNKKMEFIVVDYDISQGRDIINNIREININYHLVEYK